MQELIVELTERMRYDNAQYFVLDMSHVKFISSGCVGVLVEFLQDLAPARGRIALANCQDNVEFLFKVTRLDRVFEMFDDLGEACEELAP